MNAFLSLCTFFQLLSDTSASFPPLFGQGLELDLNRRLHGQHLARDVVLKAIQGFLKTPQPEKALVLSFHGWSGTGKNFVARLIAENLYQDGLKSECVKVFISLFHFPHPKYVDTYKVRANVCSKGNHYTKALQLLCQCFCNVEWMCHFLVCT